MARFLSLGVAILAGRPLPAAPCPEFADPHTAILEAVPGDDLAALVKKATPGTSILLAPGTYKVPVMVHITKADVTLRSKTGKRDDVILDGNNGGTPLDPERFTPEILSIRGSNVVIADLTVRHARDHAIHIHPNAGTSITGVVLHNVRVQNTGQQMVKVNSNGEATPGWADKGVIRCSLFEFTDNSVMEPWEMGGFYTGGIDVHGGEGWTVAHNTFRNIQREGKIMEHAVHFWSKSRGTVVENNRFEDVYRAIGFGMKTSPSGPLRAYADGRGASPYLDHIDGIIRNNVIWNRAGIHLETGIELANAAGAEVYHNTIWSAAAPFSGIEYRWANTKATIKNNLLGHKLVPRDGATADAAANVQNAAASAFLDAAKGDLRLAPGGLLPSVLDVGVVLAPGKAGLDADGKARDGKPDVGAYEMNGVLTALKGGRPFRGSAARIAMPWEPRAIGSAAPLLLAPAGRAFLITGKERSGAGKPR